MFENLRMKFKWIPCLICVCMLIGSTFGAGNYPFPQNAGDQYNGIYAGTAKESGKYLQKLYEEWKAKYYRESGDMARIRFGNDNYGEPENSVSEGIAYGMLIMVYMDNNMNDTKDEFDKLWNYYQNFMNGNGVMNWKISGFNSVIDANGATDAELDAAAALIMAHEQWGDQSYEDDAQTLLNTIWDHEVEQSSNLLKPGDAWRDPKNPSYFATGSLKLFNEIDNSHDWTSVANACYSLLQSASDNSTGLVPDWCDNSGNPQNPGGADHYADFYMDAVRTPWRMAWDYAWYGSSEASNLAGTIADWIKTETSGKPTGIKAGYTTSGEVVSDGEYSVSTFTGALVSAGMVGNEHQDWVDDGYLATESVDNSKYYAHTLQVIYMLLVSGNMPNFMSLNTGGDQGPPIITLEGSNPINIAVGENYTDPGYTATDNTDGDVTSSVTVDESSVNTSAEGEYEVTYTVTDAAGNTATEIRTVVVGSGGGNTVLLDDFEDGGLNEFGGAWFTFNDSNALKPEYPGGASSVEPVTTEEDTFTMSSPGNLGSDSAARITYTLDEGALDFDPFVGIGTQLYPAGDSQNVDISIYDGIKFATKGDTSHFSIILSTAVGDGAYGINIPGTEEWQITELVWDDLSLPSWVATDDEYDWDATKAVKIQWQIQAPDGTTGEFWVDDVMFTGASTGTQPGSRTKNTSSSGSYMLAVPVAKNHIAIKYNVPESEFSVNRLSIFDMSGRNVYSRSVAKSKGSIEIRDINVSSGVYFVRLSGQNKSIIGKTMFRID